MVRILSGFLALVLLACAMARGGWVRCQRDDGERVLAMAVHALQDTSSCSCCAAPNPDQSPCNGHRCDDEPLTTSALVPQQVPVLDGLVATAASLRFPPIQIVPLARVTAMRPPARGPPPHAALHRHLATIIILI